MCTVSRRETEKGIERDTDGESQRRKQTVRTRETGGEAERESEGNRERKGKRRREERREKDEVEERWLTEGDESKTKTRGTDMDRSQVTGPDT